ncbi:MAG: class I SAM-dependent methyltransferase [Pseudomonadota bacterium]
MDHAPTICVACGAELRDVLLKRNPWIIFRCTNCGLGVLDPRPSKDELETLYEKEYFQSQYDTGVAPDSPQFYRWLDLLEHRHRFFKSKKRIGTLLDIGCGNGYFLALCRKKGYEVKGIDVSKWAVQYATSILKLNVRRGEITDISFPEGTFDVITMFHSLEHTRNPSEALSQIKTWLKPDGILVIEVPNYTGTDAQKEWNHWIGWQVPYHFFHFTPSSLNRLLANYGFKITRYKDFHSETVKASLKKIPIVNLFARSIAKFFSGHSILVIAQLHSH